MKALAQEFWQEEDGLQTVELVLILVVLIGLIASLKTAANGWLQTAFGKVNSWISLIS